MEKEKTDKGVLEMRVCASALRFMPFIALCSLYHAQ